MPKKAKETKNYYFHNILLIMFTSVFISYYVYSKNRKMIFGGDRSLSFTDPENRDPLLNIPVDSSF